MRQAIACAHEKNIEFGIPCYNLMELIYLTSHTELLWFVPNPN